MAPHGLRGELKVEPMSDNPDRFRVGNQLLLGNESSNRPVQVLGSRPFKRSLLLVLSGVQDRSAAESLRDEYLLIPADQAMALDEHENYLHDLIGLAVETQEGRQLGRLQEVLGTGANDVYVVDGPDGELLVPALKDVVVKVDLQHRRMIVALPEGLEG
jgi:16S rRNA processing protein RimM